MNPVAASFALAGLATVAAGGVLAGFLRDEPAPLEPPTDPLDDRRLALLRGLADLEEARGSGALDEAEYDRLREETDGRLTRVLRAIDRRALRGHRPDTARRLSRTTTHAPRPEPAMAGPSRHGPTALNRAGSRPGSSRR